AALLGRRTNRRFHHHRPLSRGGPRRRLVRSVSHPTGACSEAMLCRSERMAMKDRRILTQFELTICGIEELSDHCEAEVSHVLSLLDPGFPDPAAFGEYGEHERLDLRFHDIIDENPGLVAPSQPDVEAILRFGEK